jgi:hypothetical protein
MSKRLIYGSFRKLDLEFTSATSDGFLHSAHHFVWTFKGDKTKPSKLPIQSYLNCSAKWRIRTTITSLFKHIGTNTQDNWVILGPTE